MTDVYECSRPKTPKDRMNIFNDLMWLIRVTADKSERRRFLACLYVDEQSIVASNGHTIHVLTNIPDEEGPPIGQWRVVSKSQSNIILSSNDGSDECASPPYPLRDALPSEASEPEWHGPLDALSSKQMKKSGLAFAMTMYRVWSNYSWIDRKGEVTLHPQTSFDINYFHAAVSCDHMRWMRYDGKDQRLFLSDERSPGGRRYQSMTAGIRIGAVEWWV
jgi:hypothetical protein